MIDGQVRRRLPAGGAVPAVRRPAYDAQRRACTSNGVYGVDRACTPSALGVHADQIPKNQDTKYPKCNACLV